MRRFRLLLLAIAVLCASGWVGVAPALAQVPIGLYGSWSSSRFPGSGGVIQMADLAVSGSGAFVGRITFSGSPCATWAQFSGRLYGDSALMSFYLGSCGLTQVVLQRQGQAWVGTYTTQYPDSGVVQMVQ